MLSSLRHPCSIASRLDVYLFNTRHFFFHSSGDCDFESGLCTYDNTQYEDQFDWLRNAGATSSWQTGPSVDHTLGTALGMKEGKKTLALIKKK